MKLDPDKIYVFTDGACQVSTGNGGYAAIIKIPLDSDGLFEKINIVQGVTGTTNNRMEMMAVIEALESIDAGEDKEIIVTSDSQYVINPFKQNWIWGWKKKNWIKSDDKPVKNADLWRRMLAAMSGKKVTFEWVRGHNGHPENEECDELAVLASHGKYGDMISNDDLKGGINMGNKKLYMYKVERTEDSYDYDRLRYKKVHVESYICIAESIEMARDYELLGAYGDFLHKIPNYEPGIEWVIDPEIHTIVTLIGEVTNPDIIYPGIYTIETANY